MGIPPIPTTYLFIRNEMEKLNSKHLYRTLWRWHFYAGVFSIPFVIILSITGAIYLFKPQIDALNDKPYRNLLITGELATADQHVAAALAASPGSTLKAYELPREKSDAVNILLNHNNTTLRAYVHPQTLKILAIKDDGNQLLRIVHDLHGELLLGKFGSILVELAACWAIVLVLTGVYLWWPRNAKGLGGIAYPRLSLTGRLFWKDLHSVIGMWVSFFVLFLLLSGLPWALVWGSALKEVRVLTGTAPKMQDWSIAGNHQHHAEASHQDHMPQLAESPSAEKASIDTIVKQAQKLNFAYPTLISPPKNSTTPTTKKNAVTVNWSVKSNAQNRMLRADAELDPYSGNVVNLQSFSERHAIDQAIGIGIAAHEGQLFGWLNQLLGLLTAIGLIIMSIAGFILWRKRAPANKLGAPPIMPDANISKCFVTIIIIAAILLPALGMSLIVLTLVEFLIFRRWQTARSWLGLS